MDTYIYLLFVSDVNIRFHCHSILRHSRRDLRRHEETVTVIPVMERAEKNQITVGRHNSCRRFCALNPSPARRILTTNRIEPHRRACIGEIQFNLYRSANDITNLINKCRRPVYLYTTCGVTGHRDKRNVTAVGLLRRVCECVTEED